MFIFIVIVPIFVLVFYGLIGIMVIPILVVVTLFVIVIHDLSRIPPFVSLGGGACASCDQ
jgi:hypothetical protein